MLSKGFSGDSVLRYRVVDEDIILREDVTTVECLYNELRNYGDENGFLKNNEVFVKSGISRYSRLLSIQREVAPEMVRVHISHGRYIQGAPDTEILTKNRGVVALKDLKDGDLLYRLSQRSTKGYGDNGHTYGLFDKDAWLFGCFACCGTYGDSYCSITFLEDESDIMNFMVGVLESNGHNVRIRHWKRGNIRGNYWELKVLKPKRVSEELAEFFSGHKVIERRIPFKVFSWSDSSILSFIAGIIDMRSSYDEKRNERLMVTGQNRVLQWQLAYLLYDVGINANNYYIDNSVRRTRDGGCLYFPHSTKLSDYCRSYKKTIVNPRALPYLDSFDKKEGKVIKVVNTKSDGNDYVYSLKTESENYILNMLYAKSL